MKLCECGCGQPTSIAQWDNPRLGYVKGQPKRFVTGHRARTGKRHYGYVTKRRESGKYEYIHRLRAEQALGRALPPKAVVHHADGTRAGDAPLVICQDQAYHRGLHARMRVQAAGGDPWRDKICSHCKNVLAKTMFHVKRRQYDGLMDSCKKCTNERNSAYQARKVLSSTASMK